MSFISILLFASAFYFAHARPEWSSDWGYGQAAREYAQGVPEYMTPMSSQLDVYDHDDLRAMGMDAFGRYLDYLLHLIKRKEIEYAERHDAEGHDAKGDEAESDAASDDSEGDDSEVDDSDEHYGVSPPSDEHDYDPFILYQRWYQSQ